jgi:polyphosphate kinase
MRGLIKRTTERVFPDSDKYLNREISWLYFNERVLQEAADPDVPLVERIRFLGIFSNNLDEFFRVRVATIRRLAAINRKRSEKFNVDPGLVLKKVNEMVHRQQYEFLSVFRQIVTCLNEQGIIILNEKSISSTVHLDFIKDFYTNQLRSQIFPIMLSEYSAVSVLRDDNTYLAVHLKKKGTMKREDFALIEVPAHDLPRIVDLPSTGDGKIYLMLLDDVIRFFLGNIFSMLDYDQFSAYTVKITRDGELDIEQDVSKSFVDRIEESLKQRDTGAPVRFVYDKAIPDKFLKIVIDKLNVTRDDVQVSGGRYHNFKDFMSFPKIGPEKNFYPVFDPLPNPDLIDTKRIIDVLDSKDVLLTFPYQSFNYIIDFLREASIHPEVRSIRMTVYRIAPNSKVMNALINAARNGKHVTVFMELQARFDERVNIYWSERLREEGIKIQHSFPGLKVHSKIIQIRRHSQNKDKFYTLVGTGNFNESTARVYGDNILMTANQDIGEEVRRVFELFEAVYRPVKFNEIQVSPFNTRKFIDRQLSRLTKAARLKQKAECIIKLNSITDKDIIDKLYKASQAGVVIKMIIRGICVLIPGLPGLSENISAISIVDRYLEHSRILYFNINGEEEFYISSADWMQRNLDNRIEITCPVYDQALRDELMTQLNFQLRDNVKARVHDNKGSQSFVKSNDPPLRSQFDYYFHCLSRISG